jgi:hypothetical protein
MQIELVEVAGFAEAVPVEHLQRAPGEPDQSLTPEPWSVRLVWTAVSPVASASCF